MKAVSVIALIGLITMGGQVFADDPFASSESEEDKRAAAELLKANDLTHCEIVLSKLPAHIAYAKGKRSLVINPKDSSQLFLVNDTHGPIRGIKSEDTWLMAEAKINGKWERCGPYELGCGTIGPSADLPPGSAYILRGVDVSVGDKAAEMRFSLRRGSEAVTVSPVFRGRYSSTALAQTRLDPISNPGIEEDIQCLLLKASRWSGPIATTPEEIAAALEIERFYDQSYRSRDAASRWLAKAQIQQDLSVELTDCANRLTAILAADWGHALDEDSMIQRCIAALEATGDAAYGTPEKCRAVVWRSLYVSMNGSRRVYLTLEQQEAANERHRSGNLWGATAGQLAAISKAADRSIGSGNAAEAEAAAQVLALSGWPKKLVPGSRLLKVLDRVEQIGRMAVVRRLAEGKNRPEVRAWLAAHQGQVGDHLGNLWGESLGGKLPEDGDINVFKAALSRGPGVVGWILSLQVRNEWAQREADWSGPYRIAIREMLEKEASGKLFSGAAGRLFAGDGRLLVSPEELLKDTRLQELATAMRVLDRWKNAEDTALFRKFLDHPGRRYADSSELGNIRIYSIREEAAHILTSRGEQVPEDLVLREKEAEAGNPK
ncbi:MAG: hypothetical protein QM755_03730 [Luteolibacter sp.]